MEPDLILWGLERLRVRRPFYNLYQDYYDGRHRVAFASERVKDAFGDLFRAFALNLCPLVVDSLADRLRIVGWSSPDVADGSAPEAQAVWERNRLPARHGRVHRDSLVLGDAYLHVWQDREGVARVYDESPLELVARHDPERPGELLGAIKAWREGKKVRVTAYYADRVERYITRQDTADLPTKLDQLRPLDERDVEPGQDARDVVTHGWGVVPVFHLANNPGHDGLGRSELRDVIPVQDALNKTVADLLATGESHALPLRYLIGVETETDPNSGRAKPMFSERGTRVVTLPKGAQAGEWQSGDLRQIIEVKREFAADVARVSGIPMHKLLQVASGDWPSGEALRVAESTMVAKADDRVGDWGPTWADGVQLGVRMRSGARGELRSLWAPTATPATDLDVARTAQARQAAGIPRAQTWREMGYSETQIEEFSAAYAEEQRAAAEARAAQFDSGLLTGGF